MSQLVDGLLVLARADAGVALERRPVDLRAVATEEARRFRATGRTRDEAQGVDDVPVGDGQGVCAEAGIALPGLRVVERRG